MDEESVMSFFDKLNPLNWFDVFPKKMDTSDYYWGRYISYFFNENKKKNINPLSHIAKSFAEIFDMHDFQSSFIFMGTKFTMTFHNYLPDNDSGNNTSIAPDLLSILPETGYDYGIKATYGQLFNLDTGMINPIIMKEYGKIFLYYYRKLKGRMPMSNIIVFFVSIMTVVDQMMMTGASSGCMTAMGADHKPLCYVVFSIEGKNKYNDFKNESETEDVSIDYTAPQEVQDLTIGRINAALNGNEKVIGIKKTEHEGKVTGVTITVLK